jgi:hypothetical protein
MQLETEAEVSLSQDSDTAADHRNSPLSITEIPQAMSGVEGLISAYATVKLAPPD